MATATKARIGVEEFERQYLGKQWVELWRGEVREKMPASRGHGRIAMRIGSRIATFSEQRGLGETHAAETGFVIETPEGKSVLGPDAAFIRKERIPPDLPDTGFCRIAPDLVVEVRSPDDTLSQIQEKAREWLAGGVQIVWLIDPTRRVVEVWRPNQPVRTLTDADTLSGEEILPEFEMAVRELWE
ncbi:MAG: Uma2 family endonuclease [Fimbriimonadales bacterium]|nr:Uma2 family endonuclease [Fimbriimonadales bacterium]